MGLELKCLLYRPAQKPAEIRLDEISEHVRDTDSFLWIDISDARQPMLTRLGEELGLHELAIEDALTMHQRPKLEEYGGHLFIVAKTAQLQDEHMLFDEIHFFVGANFVVAVHHGPRLDFARVSERLSAARNGIRPGSPYALYLALDLIVDHYRPVLESIHERFLSLESLLLTDALERADLEKLYNIKRELNSLRDAAEPMQDIVLDLIRLHPEFVTRELKAYYRDVHDHSIHVTDAIDTLRTNASDAMQFHHASLTIRQNESVQKLAGWGAILAVPTVIFSLYGMNFDWMPELHQKWGYPAVLSASAAIMVWLYMRLRKRGWI
ncbi:MAG: magnesium/cobalt transporter CorA [Pseudomonadota bacterium]